MVIRGEEGQGGFAIPSFSYHDETIKLDNGITKYVPKYDPLKSFQDVVVQSLLLGYASLSYNLQTNSGASTRLYISIYEMMEKCSIEGMDVHVDQ